MKYKGFTFFELIVTVAVFVILSLLAMSNWHHLVIKNNLSMVTEQLINAIQLARSKAIQFGQVVSLCGSSDQKHCDGQWSRGQIVIIQGSHQVIRVFSAVPTTLNLDWRSSFSINNKLSFNANGFTQGQQGHFIVSVKNKNVSPIKIIVSGTGRLRINSNIS